MILYGKVKIRFFLNVIVASLWLLKVKLFFFYNANVFLYETKIADVNSAKHVPKLKVFLWLIVN